MSGSSWKEGPIATGGNSDGTVGREEECARLREAVGRAGEGEGTTLAISGEPGIGKSRLLAELVQLADEAGQLTLSGRAAQFERDVPFAVFVDALDGYLASQNPRRLEALGTQHLTELARIFPATEQLAEEGGGGAGQGERYRAHYAVGALLEQLAAARPLVLALDDLQWADEASLELVSHLLRRPPRGAQLLALAYRPGEAPPRLSSAVEAALREERVEPMELDPLTEEQTGAVVSDEVDAETLAWLYRESGGNPFYLEQLHRSVEGASRPPIRERPSGSAKEVPPAVAAALADELAALSAPARRLIEGASVAGDPFRLELAAAATELTEATSRDALDELLSRGLAQPIEAPRRFRFRHPLVRKAVYADARSGWRIGAHARVRDLLEEEGASPTALAHHVDRAATPGDKDAIAVLQSAGHAAAQLAPGPAADWFAAALRLLPEGDTARRLELLVPMATALAASGRMEESRAPLTEAIELMPAEAEEERVGVIAFLAGVDHLVGHHDEATDLLRSAREVLPNPTSPAAIVLEIELASDANYTSDFEKARYWADRALAHVKGSGERGLHAAAEALVALTSLLPERIAQAEPHRAEAAETIDALDDGELADRLVGVFWLVHAELFMERYEDAERHFRRALAISRATGQGQFVPNMQVTGAWALIYLGRPAEAAELVEEGIEGARLTGNRQSLGWGLWVRAWIAGAIGDFDTAFEFAEESLGIGDALDDNVISVAGRAHIAHVCAEAGQYERCYELMELAGAPDFPRFYADRPPHFWEALSRAALAQGRTDEAEQWVARGEAFVDGLGLPVATGAIRRARGRLLLAGGDPEPAAELALEAVAGQERRGARIEAARSRILAGQALAAADQPERAVAELERAYAELDACGVVRYRDEAGRELRRLGRTVPSIRAPAPAPAGDGVRGLSGRERRIAELAAEAKTNREIAATLYISEKTVEKHLTKVFAKLDVKGRAAIGAKLAGEAAPAEAVPPQK